MLLRISSMSRYSSRRSPVIGRSDCVTSGLVTCHWSLVTLRSAVYDFFVDLTPRD